MDILFVFVFITLVLCFAYFFREKFAKHDSEKLEDEIQNDILEEFQLSPENIEPGDGGDLDSLVRWLEEEQLRDRINDKG